MALKEINLFEKNNPLIDEKWRLALEELFQDVYFPEMERAGNDVKIVLTDTLAYRKILTLKNVKGELADLDGYYRGEVKWFFEEDEKRYYMCGQIEDIIEDTEESFEASFESLEVEIEVYNACVNATIEDNPWSFLRDICSSIYWKAESVENGCNDEEIALLPLMREIVSLERYWLLPLRGKISFENLKILARQYGYKKVEALLGKLETIEPEKMKFRITAYKLHNLLCEQKCEPLWRDIFDKISKTQIGYSNKVEALCNQGTLSEIRKEIQKLMESKGYEGKYPDFIKKGRLKGIHLEGSYDVTYFVGMEKRAEYRVHCSEDLEENGHLTVQFLCGTAFLKKNEQVDDIYSCVFNAKGRRLFRLVHYYEPISNEYTEDDIELEALVNIAVKKAECIKLNKIERKWYYGRMISGWSFFFSFFFIVGGISSVCFTLLMMAYITILIILFGTLADVPRVLSELPWMGMLIFCWIGFGGAMGITELLARRK